MPSLQQSTLLFENFKPTYKTRGIKKPTANDVVYTRISDAKYLINKLNPQGSILDPCAGGNAFYNNFPNIEKYRCEIAEGNDFFDWEKKVDWIISNPPYSIYTNFLIHAMKVADNIAFLIPIHKLFTNSKLEKQVLEYGGLKELIYMGGGRTLGFPFGFPVVCIHYQRGYTGHCKITKRV